MGTDETRSCDEDLHLVSAFRIPTFNELSEH